MTASCSYLVDGLYRQCQENTFDSWSCSLKCILLLIRHKVCQSAVNRGSLVRFEDEEQNTFIFIIKFLGVSSIGRAVGFGPEGSGFESLIPSHYTFFRVGRLEDAIR